MLSSGKGGYRWKGVQVFSWMQVVWTELSCACNSPGIDADKLKRGVVVNGRETYEDDLS